MEMKTEASEWVIDIITAAHTALGMLAEASATQSHLIPGTVLRGSKGITMEAVFTGPFRTNCTFSLTLATRGGHGALRLHIEEPSGANVQVDVTPERDSYTVSADPAALGVLPSLQDIFQSRDDKLEAFVVATNHLMHRYRVAEQAEA